MHQNLLYLLILMIQQVLIRSFSLKESVVRLRRSSLISRLSLSSSGTNTTTLGLSSKEKRKKFVGVAKTLDRGQFSVTYSPGGLDGSSFQAKSGLPDLARGFTVLGIESSCDDTGAAVVRSDGVILGESLASQHEIHEKFGGVVPSLAKSAHEENVDRVIAEAIERAGLDSLQDVDAIGVTVGPGLEICLRVGCNKARDLAIEYNKPFVAVHHLEAHILMARLPSLKTLNDANHHSVHFPFLALLVSGGHCLLLNCIGVGRYHMIGGTIDDSLGEAFDKTARMLGLPLGRGGGPAVESIAIEGDPDSIPLPIPLQNRKDCDFSFAGLKTAVNVAADKLRIQRGLDSIHNLSRSDKANIAASFQNTAIKHVEQRLQRAMTLFENQTEGPVRTLAVVGGVAANKNLRSRLELLCAQREEAWSMTIPSPQYCTDQGTMSAWAAIERLLCHSSDDPEHQTVYARYPFQQSHYQ